METVFSSAHWRCRSLVEHTELAAYYFAATPLELSAELNFGLGSGLQAARRVGLDEQLADMYANWHFFANFLSNVSMTLAKTHMEIAAHHVRSLVSPDFNHLYATIREEYALTVEEVLWFKGIVYCVSQCSP